MVKQASSPGGGMLPFHFLSPQSLYNHCDKESLRTAIASAAKRSYHVLKTFVRTSMFVPLSYHSPTTLVPLSYHSLTTLVPLSYHFRTTLVPRSYHSRTTLVQLPYYFCTTLVPLSYHSRTTLVPLPYHSRTTLAPFHTSLATRAPGTARPRPAFPYPKLEDRRSGYYLSLNCIRMLLCFGCRCCCCFTTLKKTLFNIYN